MTRFVLALAAVLILAGPAFAISDPSEALPNRQEEARAVAIGKQLRCLVCQNESIEDSGADLARDLRHIVRQQVAEGRTNQQIIDWLVKRYGNFVRLKPPFEPSTYLLWFSPVLAVAIGAGIAFAARRSRPAVPPPLSPAEQKRLSQILDT